MLKSGEESTDIETTPDTSGNQGSARGRVGGLMSMFSKAPVEKPVPTTFTGKMIAKLPEESDKSRAFIFFGLSLLFYMLAFFNILAIVISPAKFTCSFTIGVILSMFGLCLWNGPQ